jgi:predicted nucleotidyltransferase
MTREELLSDIKARLQRAHGERLQGVILYGSEARGEAAEDSDLDLMVLLKGPVELGEDLRTNVDALYELEGELLRSLHAMPVDIEAFNAGEYALYRNAKKEGIWL